MQAMDVSAPSNVQWKNGSKHREGLPVQQTHGWSQRKCSKKSLPDPQDQGRGLNSVLDNRDLFVGMWRNIKIKKESFHQDTAEVQAKYVRGYGRRDLSLESKLYTQHVMFNGFLANHAQRTLWNEYDYGAMRRLSAN